MARGVEIVHKRLTVWMKKFIYFVACAFDGTYQPICFASALSLKDNKGKRKYIRVSTFQHRAARQHDMLTWVSDTEVKALASHGCRLRSIRLHAVTCALLHEKLG